jgi:hypothetical protein
MSSTGIPSALQRRLAVYEYIQEQHRLQPQVSAIVSPHVDLRLVIDLADLPRLQIRLISPDVCTYTTRIELSRYQVIEAIEVIPESQLRARNLIHTDILIIHATEIENLKISYSAIQHRYLLISGEITENQQQLLSQRTFKLGWQTVSNDPLIYKLISEKIVIF